MKTPGHHEGLKQGSRTRTIPLIWATSMCFGVLAVFALLTQAGVASADTFKVTNTHSSGSGSLRHAIKQANSGGDHSDTIAIKATGTIRLGSRLPNLRTHLAIKGPGAGKLTVRRDRGTSSTFSIFTVSPHVTVRMSGISITNGLGSGIDTKGRLTLSHSVVSDNKGAGVEIDDFGTVTASQVRVRDNGGGGLEGDKRFITVRRSTLSGNGGRAISSDRGDITVSRSKLSRNLGGGITSDGGDIVVSRSTLRDNCVVGGDLCDSGGGIFNRTTPSTLGRLTRPAQHPERQRSDRFRRRHLDRRRWRQRVPEHPERQHRA